VADRELLAFREAHGHMALQGAIMNGQYSYADGVFYGGLKPAWSQQALAAILKQFAGKAQEVAFIDLHTGLGPSGVGEIISNHENTENERERAALGRVREWYGDEATTVEDGTSSSSQIVGDIGIGVQAALPQANITGITLEYGTVPLESVLNAVRADNWLHVHGKLKSDQARDIKAEIRGAFYGETDDWKRQVYERSVAVLDKALAGLAQRPVR
jgi:hypothetical protein